MKHWKGIRNILLLAFMWPALVWAEVDINVATAEQIAAELNGVGAAKAQAIVDFRNQHGRFESADELVEVKGIGTATVEKNRDKIVIKPVKE